MEEEEVTGIKEAAATAAKEEEEDDDDDEDDEDGLGLVTGSIWDFIFMDKK